MPIAAVPPPLMSFLPWTRPTIDEATIAAVAEVLRSGRIGSGMRATEFETRLSEYFGGRPVRVFNSGACTLEVALRIAGVGRGDEVITTPLAWVATGHAILAVGAKPVFVDVEASAGHIDLAKAEAAITRSTKAIVPVDLAGRSVDRERLYALAERYRLRVVEDAAEALGSSSRGRKIGASGDLVAFGFGADKAVTSVAGGCLVLNDEAEARLASQYRSLGVTRAGFDSVEVDVVGGDFNLTDVAACVGTAQLTRIDEFTAQRRELARAYFEEFDALTGRASGLGLPPREFEESNWQRFQIVLPERLAIGRAEVMARLQERGIGTAVHYPAMHLFAVYRELGWTDGAFPVAEKLGRNLLTLPLFPGMTREEVKRVVSELSGVVAGAMNA
jgi:dTDP-4-amino-4,6-dideoxygalactose transaminase